MKKLYGWLARLFSLSAIILGIGAIMKLLTGVVLRERFIIEQGVRVFNLVQIYINFVIGLGLLLFAIALILMVVSMLRSRAMRRQDLAQKQQRSRMMMDYAEDSDNPEAMRKWLQQMQREMPAFREVIGRCLSQMDRMDELQTKQEFLIKMNSAAYLRDTIAVLLNVEKRICRSFRNIINLCIAGNITYGRDNRSNLEAILDDNDKKLNSAGELLRASADWINHYNDDNDGDRSELENWIAVIRESLKED